MLKIQDRMLLSLFRMWRVVILVCVAAARAELAEEEESQRQERVLSVFNVVTFPNSACGASSGYNGTCYTSSGEWTIKVDRFSYNGF